MTRETGAPHEVTAWAVDIDVSGSVDPFKAPELGPWLRAVTPECQTNDCAHSEDEPCMGQWDVLVCWKIDRLSRTTINSYRLLEWCKKHGKRIKATHDQIDPDSRIGELLWFILSWLAEGELEAIKDRTKGTREWIIHTNRWPGGTMPYGYVQIANPDQETGGWVLVADPAMLAVITDMIIWTIDDGKSASWIARNLNELDVPGPYKGRGYKPRGRNRTRDSLNGEWTATAVLRILRSLNLLGIRTYTEWTTDSETGKKIKGKTSIVLSKKTGLPVQFAEPLIKRSTYEALQEALDRNSRPRSEDSAVAYGNSLPEIGMCAVCGRRLYRNFTTRNGQKYQYFVCSGRRGSQGTKTAVAKQCGNRSVPREELWNRLESYLLEELGEQRWQERTVIPGSDHRDALQEAQDSMSLLLQRAGSIKSEGARKIFNDQIEALDATIAELSALPVVPRREEWSDTDKTFRQHWDGLTEDQKVALLHSTGSYVSVLRWPGELSAPEQHPEWPTIDFGGTAYALGPYTNEGKTFAKGPGIYHVNLGGQLQKMLNNAA